MNGPSWKPKSSLMEAKTEGISCMPSANFEGTAESTTAAISWKGATMEGTSWKPAAMMPQSAGAMVEATVLKPESAGVVMSWKPAVMMPQVEETFCKPESTAAMSQGTSWRPQWTAATMEGTSWKPAVMMEGISRKPESTTAAMIQGTSWEPEPTAAEGISSAAAMERTSWKPESTRALVTAGGGLLFATSLLPWDTGLDDNILGSTSPNNVVVDEMLSSVGEDTNQKESVMTPKLSRQDDNSGHGSSRTLQSTCQHGGCPPGKCVKDSIGKRNLGSRHHLMTQMAKNAQQPARQSAGTLLQLRVSRALRMEATPEDADKIKLPHTPTEEDAQKIAKMFRSGSVPMDLEHLKNSTIPGKPARRKSMVTQAQAAITRIEQTRLTAGAVTHRSKTGWLADRKRREVLGVLMENEKKTRNVCHPKEHTENFMRDEAIPFCQHAIAFTKTGRLAADEETRVLIGLILQDHWDAQISLKDLHFRYVKTKVSQTDDGIALETLPCWPKNIKERMALMGFRNIVLDQYRCVLILKSAFGDAEGVGMRQSDETGKESEKAYLQKHAEIMHELMEKGREAQKWKTIYNKYQSEVNDLVAQQTALQKDFTGTPKPEALRSLAIREEVRRIGAISEYNQATVWCEMYEKLRKTLEEVEEERSRSLRKPKFCEDLDALARLKGMKWNTKPPPIHYEEDEDKGRRTSDTTPPYRPRFSLEDPSPRFSLEDLPPTIPVWRTRSMRTPKKKIKNENENENEVTSLDPESSLRRRMKNRSVSLPSFQ